MCEFARACVLTVKSSSSNRKEGTGCGTLIDTCHGYAIAHSTVLAPFLLDNLHLIKKLELFSKQSSNLSDIINLNIEVFLEKLVSHSIPEKYSLMKYRSALVNSNVEDKSPVMAIYSASLMSFFKCTKFKQTMQRLMPRENWKFTNDMKEIEKGPQIEEDNLMYRLLPYFILVKIDKWSPYDSALKVRPAENCSVGETVELVTTPFANLFTDIMLNSVSKGVVCNLAGRNHCFILSDARCIPGSEGGPLFTRHHDKRLLTGIVVSSVCWKSGEWLGFSLACSAQEVLASLPDTVVGMQDRIGQEISIIETPGKLALTLNHVVLIKVGSSWGSGVILGQSEGLVLTCSHVVQDNQAKDNHVKLKMRPKSPLLDCKILHQTNRGMQFDLAVLSCKGLGSHLSYLPLAHPKEGMTVYVVGHATFGDDLDLYPSVTSGVISKVIRVNSIPVMVQTTCAVHPGTSGGALLDEDCHLVGIVVSNAKDTATGACYPHVNMCVPMVTIWPVLTTYIRTKDAKVLRYLNLQNGSIDTLWTLGKPSSDSTMIASRL